MLPVFFETAYAEHFHCVAWNCGLSVDLSYDVYAYPSTFDVL